MRTRPGADGQPRGFVKGIKVITFRPTRDQRRELEDAARARGVTVGQEARDRCFPAQSLVDAPELEAERQE